MLLHWLIGLTMAPTWSAAETETLTEQVCPALWPIASLALWRFILHLRCVWSNRVELTVNLLWPAQQRFETWTMNVLFFHKMTIYFYFGQQKKGDLGFCPLMFLTSKDESLRITSWHCGWSKPCLAKERHPANTHAVCSAVWRRSVVSVGEKALLTMQINIFLNVCCKVA